MLPTACHEHLAGCAHRPGAFYMALSLSAAKPGLRQDPPLARRRGEVGIGGRHEDRPDQIGQFRYAVHRPAYPRPPFRFSSREYLIISYETDPDAVAAIVPEPLQLAAPVVHYEF